MTGFFEGHRQLALEIVRVLEQAGHLRMSWTEADQSQVKQAVESRITKADQASALVTLAKVLAWAGKADEAYGLAQRAVALTPDDASAQFEAGKEAARLGRPAEAIVALRRAVELRPRFVEARSLLGLQLLNAGRAEEAIQHGREAVALRPDDPQLLLNLGAMFERTGRATEAEEQFRRVIRVSPKYAEAHNNLGWLLKDRGAWDEAMASFREAIRHRPGSTMPMLGLAWLLATHPDPSRRQPAEAVRIVEPLTASTQPDWMVFDTLGVAYAAAGRFPEAIEAANRAFDLLTAMRRAEATNVAARAQLFRGQRPFIEPSHVP
jgi:Flp pilus assembly protein TadD